MGLEQIKYLCDFSDNVNLNVGLLQNNSTLPLIRSDSQTTGLTLTTGAPYSCTNGRGCEQYEYIHFDVISLLTVVWRSHSGQIVWAA